MVGKMLHGEEVSKVNRLRKKRGAVTSGGTESIYNAMYVYREWGSEDKGISAPEVVAPATIHPAHLKAAHYLGMKVVRVPVNADFEADVEAMRAAITPNTVALAGSAGTYPHGVVDPISRLSDLAVEHKLGLHVDGCLGGFILPWIERLGYDVPVVRLPPAGGHLHLLRYAQVRLCPQGHLDDKLPQQEPAPVHVLCTGGLAGRRLCLSDRAGQPVSRVECRHVGCHGLHGRGRATWRLPGPSWTRPNKMRAGIAGIPELRIMGKSTFLISLTSDVVNPYFVNDYLHSQGWRMNGCQNPAGFHFCITLPQTQPGIAERFVKDLEDGVLFAKDPPYEVPKTGFLYGMGATPDGREMMRLGLKGYVEASYDYE